jgi:NADH dehydrogenase
VALRRALDGVQVLHNTYWVRFEKAGFSHARAVARSRALFAAAKAAGVERVVHVSITNPSLDSPYTYFRGKAEVEEALKATGVSHAVLRPAVLFGGPDILLNNIAWMLRRFPVFGIVGDGAYRLQPIHVDDLAALALAEGTRRDDVTLDAIGPETWSYRDLVEAIGAAVGRARRIVRIPRPLALAFATGLGWLVRDVVLTRAEVDALMDDLLVTDSPPSAPTRLSAWLEEHGDALGRTYANELTRRRRRDVPYVPAAPAPGSLAT